MKSVTIQIKVNVPNNYQLNDGDDILQLLNDFPHNIIYLEGKVIR